jgi:hypothetical protein
MSLYVEFSEVTFSGSDQVSCLTAVPLVALGTSRPVHAVAQHTRDQRMARSIEAGRPLSWSMAISCE